MTRLPMISREEQGAIARLHAASFGMLEVLRGFIRNRRSITTDPRFDFAIDWLMDQGTAVLEEAGFWPDAEAGGDQAPARILYRCFQCETIVRDGEMHRVGVECGPKGMEPVDITQGPLVLLESPFAGEVALNVAYARHCMRDSLLRGEHPIASHLLYTQPGILNDDDPGERKRGIEAGLAWRRAAQKAVFYTARGWSMGMLAARDVYDKEGFPYEVRAWPEPHIKPSAPFPADG